MFEACYIQNCVITNPPLNAKRYHVTFFIILRKTHFKVLSLRSNQIVELATFLFACQWAWV